MAGSKNHDGARMSDAQVLESFQQGRFFVFDGAAADENGAGTLGSQCAPKALDNRLRSGDADIELEIAGDAHAGRIGADGFEALPVFCGLGKK